MPRASSRAQMTSARTSTAGWEAMNNAFVSKKICIPSGILMIDLCKTLLKEVAQHQSRLNKL
eukprot:6757736-Lingulodinium_polyedra.AAC.1